MIRLMFNDFTVIGARLLIGTGSDPSDEDTVILSRETSNVPYSITADSSEVWVLVSFSWESVFEINVFAYDKQSR